MLGLADRGRILDLFEKLMGGKISDALTDLSELYDRGADPLVVMQDLLETTHFLTRVKVAPAAQGFFDGGSAEAKRAAEMATKLSVPSLTRAWQLLLRGLIEVRDATQALAACEMALIRLAYAADLPPHDKLVRDILDGPSASAPSHHLRLPGRGEKIQRDFSLGEDRSSPRVLTPSPPEKPALQSSTLPQGEGGRANASIAPAAIAETASTPTIRIGTLEELAALAQAKGSPVLRVQIENNVRLIRLEPGHLEFAPTPVAPGARWPAIWRKKPQGTWTGMRWSVIVAREGGMPTLAEQKKSAKAARLESVLQEPFVRAVLDRFPGAEVIAVRDLVDEEVAQPMPEKDSE